MSNARRAMSSRDRSSLRLAMDPPFLSGTRARVPLAIDCLLRNLRLELARPFEVLLNGRQRASRPFRQRMLIAVLAAAALDVATRLRRRSRHGTWRLGRTTRRV